MLFAKEPQKENRPEMRTSALLYLGTLILMAAMAVVVFRSSGFRNTKVPAMPVTEQSRNDSDVRVFEDKRVIAYGLWEEGDADMEKLSYLARAFDHDPNYKGAGVTLAVLNRAGSVIYQDYFTNLHRVYRTNALRGDRPHLDPSQLVVEVDYGGSSAFLLVLDYQNGKIVDLMNAANRESDFDIGAEVRPQLRTGVNPAITAYQILLTNGVSLASPAEKLTRVFRYKDGSYRFQGEFPQRKLDDYMEKLITDSRAKQKSLK
jgi:hypothetical protein